MRRFIINFFMMFSFAVGANANLLKCADLFSPQKVVAPQKTNLSFKENWAAVVSRIKTTYQNSSFDLRILSTRLSKNRFSPAELREKAIQEMSFIQSAYQKLGFSFNSYIQVLVEAHPGAISEMGFNDRKKLVWNKMAESTPWVGGAHEFIGIPNLLGLNSLFYGKTNKRGFPDAPRILVLPAMTETYHSIQNHFVMTHELAHETEKYQSHRDLMWREARADFLAFLISGATDLAFPEGYEATFVREDGSTYKKRVTVLRSLIHPEVKSVDKLWPSLDFYHANSQILSSALYQIAQTVGNNKAVELIKWMDQRDGEEAIPYLRSSTRYAESPGFDPQQRSDFVDPNNIHAVRTAVADHLIRAGQLFRKWLNESGLESSEKEAVLAILSEKGL